MDLQSINTTISEANQTAVPSKVRKILNLKSGDRLSWKVEADRKSVKVKPIPRDWGAHMSGLGANVWKGVDIEKYIREGRKDRKIR